ncbi:MAG: ATP-binding cassette domain-containing protein [Kiritimatiellae bacterium]|nr:ATP-binding cassette domain-containing protein [Kiritimatiellia bacterium]MDW8458447.1 ATP-binding cassette domain-containing protein [Verrucomicrobiota bacterium]
MIEVSHLTKRYPGRVAVDDVSFTVSPGEIVGFLGPNGAGKTTTMRILAGYLPPTSGSVRVADLDVADHPVEVRRRIGYLPENCPLYLDMRVDEYLRFRARLKGVPRNRLKQRLQEVKERCGIADSGNRIIGQLSKGYRQRVGLAEALVHDPDLLILDEPTIGLDPNQIRSVRELIASLADRHTILLSSHILHEVEMLCRRVLIIHRGRLVASDSTDRLRNRLAGESAIAIEWKAPREEAEAALRSLPGVLEVQVADAGDWLKMSVRAAKNEDPRPEIGALSAARGWPLRELHLEAATLEDVFVALTRSERTEVRA